MKKQKLIAALLALTMVFGLVGSASAAGRSPSASREANALSVMISTKINSIDPQLFTSTAEDAVTSQIYEALFISDNDGNPVMILADSITPNEDGSVVEVTLKENVKFHSGDVLTAQDVAFTLSRCENSPLCSTLYAYSSIEVVDDTHLIWNFPYAAAGAGYYELSSSITTMGIVNESFCLENLAAPTDNLNLLEDGTGAYVLEGVAASGDVTLKRFADYHGEASIDTLTMKVITGSQEIAFESGDIDEAMYTAVTIETVKGYDNVVTESQLANNVVFLINNCRETSPLNNIQVRQAVALAMNRQDVALIASDGGATVAYNLATPMVNYYDDVCNHYDQDLDRANALMQEAGYSKSNRCPVTLLVMSAYPQWVAACEILKENLEQSYFSVSIEETADLDRYFNGNFDIAFLAVGLTESFTGYSVLFDDASGLNLCGISGDEQMELLAKITAAVDEESTHAAMQAVVDQLGYIPVLYTTYYMAFDSELNHGTFYISRGGFLYREFSWK